MIRKLFVNLSTSSKSLTSPIEMITFTLRYLVTLPMRTQRTWLRIRKFLKRQETEFLNLTSATALLSQAPFTYSIGAANGARQSRNGLAGNGSAASCVN